MTDPIWTPSFANVAAIEADPYFYAQSNLSFTNNRLNTGSTVDITGNGSLKYHATTNFNFQKGTIEFWVRPNDDYRYILSTSGTIYKYFLTFFDGSYIYSTSPHALIIAISSAVAGTTTQAYNRFEATFDRSGTTTAYVTEPYSVMTWTSGSWHKVILYWDLSIANPGSYIVAKIDDAYGIIYKGAPISTPSFNDPLFFIGSGVTLGSNSGNAAYDEFKIWNVSLLPYVFSTNPLINFNPQDVCPSQCKVTEL